MIISLDIIELLSFMPPRQEVHIMAANDRYFKWDRQQILCINIVTKLLFLNTIITVNNKPSIYICEIIYLTPNNIITTQDDIKFHPFKISSRPI